MSPESDQDLARCFFQLIGDRISVHFAGVGARGVRDQDTSHVHVRIQDDKLHGIRETFDPCEVTTDLAKARQHDGCDPALARALRRPRPGQATS